MANNLLHDSLGDVEVPAEALYGAQTQRAIENFRFSDFRFPRPFLAALGLIKRCSAEVNGERAARILNSRRYCGDRKGAKCVPKALARSLELYNKKSSNRPKRRERGPKTLPPP